MNAIPQELDWVGKRAACTIAKVFNELCDGIMSDVAAINTARAGESLFSADMHSDGSTIFVGQPGRIPRRRVTIGTGHDQLVVVQEWNKEQWSASIGLNDEGRCILRLDDGTELEQWQFRKKALEGLFFDGKEQL
jgi:hypothetical protein